MKLGTALLRDAMIGLAQLEAALRAQVLYGGRLGTNLVELGFIDLDTLGVYLSRISRFPLADRQRFEHAPLDLVHSFDPELARRYVAFPLGPEPGEPDAIGVALAHPNNKQTLDEIANFFGRIVIPYIAPELRIYYYLEHHLDIQRKARFLRTSGAVPTETAERRRQQPAGGIAKPPVATVQPRAKRISSGPPPLPDSHTPRCSLTEAAAAILAAPDRQAIGRALIDFAEGRFGALLAFLVRKSNAVGWVGYSGRTELDRQALDNLSLPLGGASALQAALDGKATYRGPGPAAGRPIETQIWQLLSLHQPPEQVVVVPVILHTRVVNLIYGHGIDGGPPDNQAVEALERLAELTADTYVRLIRGAQAKHE